MTLLLEATVKISLVIALGLIAALAMRRKPAALRHWMLASAVAAALATPLLMRLAPSWNLPVQQVFDASPPAPRAPSAGDTRIGITTRLQLDRTSSQTSTRAVEAAGIVLTIWLAGLTLHLARLTLGLWRLRRLARRATPVDRGPWAECARELSEHFGLHGPVRLLLSDRPAMLMTWGVLHPTVLLPRDALSWGADRIRVVLAHELAHIQRRDWIVQIASDFLRIACWFNPLVWYASWRLRLESERACDDAVVNLGVSGSDYAEHLLELARQFGRTGHTAVPAVAIVPRRSTLERRVTAMLNVHLSRGPVSRPARLTALAGLLAVALPVALFGQNRFSAISGTVTDPSGGLLPGVTVVALDTTRDARHEVKTSRTGQFELIGLPDGPIVLEATLPGFQKFQQKIALDGQDVNRNITLRVGSLQEVVTVSRGQGAVSPSFGSRPAPPKLAECGASTGRGGAANPGTLRIGGQIRQPLKTRHVNPVFPEGVAPGVVTLEAVIGPDGFVTDAKVLRSPAPALALAAENAVRQWEFTPTLLNCVPVPVIMTVTVDFN